jgi:hypothetical protein
LQKAADFLPPPPEQDPGAAGTAALDPAPTKTSYGGTNGTSSDSDAETAALIQHIRRPGPTGPVGPAPTAAPPH